MSQSTNDDAFSVVNLNISHNFLVTDTSTRINGIENEAEEEKLLESSSMQINDMLTELKCIILERSSLFLQQDKNIQELDKRLLALRKTFDDEKRELDSSILFLKQIHYLKKISKVEKETKNLVSGSDTIFQSFEKLMEIVNHEINKLELKNCSWLSNDEFTQALTEALCCIETFIKNDDFAIIHTFASQLHELEEATKKLNCLNKECAEVIERINRLLLHKEVFEIIQNSK